MIRLKVVEVARKSSSQFFTTHITYDEKGKATPTRMNGAEWEDVAFIVVPDEQPIIQVANVSGSVVIAGGQVFRIIINDPKLFGTYKIDDIIELVSVRELEASKQTN